MLTCYLVRRRIGAYLDGGLEPRPAGMTAAHLGVCEGCRREADGLRRLRAILRRNLAVAEPTDWTGFWPGVVRGIEDARHAPSPATKTARERWWRPVWAAGVAVAAAIVMSVTLWQSADGPGGPEAGVVVRSADTDDPRATVMVYSTPEQDVAVVWVFGLE